VEAGRSTFDEVWETVRDRFYDRDLHGLDWPAMRRETEMEDLAALGAISLTSPGLICVKAWRCFSRET